MIQDPKKTIAKAEVQRDRAIVWGDASGFASHRGAPAGA
jgi:hypothetical protein